MLFKKSYNNIVMSNYVPKKQNLEIGQAFKQGEKLFCFQSEYRKQRIPTKPNSKKTFPPLCE